MERKRKPTTKTVSARLELDFKKEVINHAKEQGMTVSEYIKYLIMKDMKNEWVDE